MTEDFFKGGRVVVRQDDGVLPRSFGKPGALGDCSGVLDWSKLSGIRTRATEADGQEIMRSMIPTLEFGNQGAPCRGACQPQRIHGCLGPRVAEGDLFHPRHHIAKQLCKGVLALVALSVVCPAWQRLANRHLYFFGGVPEDHDRKAQHKVQVFIVICIPDPGPTRPLDDLRKRIRQPEDAPDPRWHDGAVLLPDRQ